MKPIYIITRRRIAFHMNGDHITAVGVAQKSAFLREMWPNALEVRELMPAIREDRSWYDADSQKFYLSTLTVFDFACWLIAEGRLQPVKTGIGWHVRMRQIDAWFGGGTGDTVPSMLREAVAIALGKPLDGEDEYFKSRSYDSNPGAWAAVHIFAKSKVAISPPMTIEVS